MQQGSHSLVPYIFFYGLFLSSFVLILRDRNGEEGGSDVFPIYIVHTYYYMSTLLHLLIHGSHPQSSLLTTIFLRSEMHVIIIILQPAMLLLHDFVIHQSKYYYIVS